MLKPSSCRDCYFYNYSNSFSQPEGLCQNGVLIIGESLGHNEAIDGLPFRQRGAAGSLLEQCFRICRTDRSQFLIDNLIRCEPHGEFNGYRPNDLLAINHCTEKYASRVYCNPNVKCVLALGSIAFRNITGISGKKLGIGDVRGYAHSISNRWFDNIPVIGSYHPAHIRRGKLAYTDYLIHDIRKAMGVANGTYKSFGSSEEYRNSYQLSPSIDDAKSFYYRVRDNESLCLAYDIETPNSSEHEEDERDEIVGEPITSIQFSLGKGEGIYMPWEGNYVKVAKAILKRSNRKLCFNGWHFDNPKLVANDCGINGKIVDLMWKFHYLKPDLEMGLQKVASICDFPFHWKHYANDNRMNKFYGVVDCDVLFWIEEKIDKVLGSMKVPIA